MWSRFFRRFLFTSALAAVLLCLAPKLAHAQTITIYQETSLPRVNFDKDGALVQVKKRAINLTPEGVSHQDCLDNVRIRFPVQLAGFQGNGSLEVWAGLSGNQCSDQQVRTSANRTCWKLVSGLPLALNQNVDIPVRTIMAGVSSPATPDDSASICGKIDLTTVAVNFLYFAPGQTATPAATHSISVQVDTIGPSAPTGLNVLPGNTRLQMSWNSISGESGVSVLTGIRVYCDPSHSTEIPNTPECAALIAERNAAPLTPSDTDASTSTTEDSGTVAAVLPDGGCIEDTDDAGNPIPGTCDAATSSGSTDLVDGSSVGTGGACESTNLAPPTGSFTPSAAFNSCFSCGSISGNTGTSIVATDLRGKPLVNGTVYAVAVAATDAFDNVGPLSTPLCEYPEVTADFWQDYKNAGGRAGGGCATTGESPVGSIAALSGAGAVIFSIMRRRRKRKAK